MKTRNRSRFIRDDVISKIQVLLLGSYKTALKRDAFWSLYKHQVTITSKASAGLSMILNGGTFDCVLVDSEECDISLKYFVHHSSKLLPALKIILMVPNPTPKEIFEMALCYKAVWLHIKPCALGEISNVFKYIIDRKIELLKKETDGRSIQRRKYSNFPKTETWNTLSIEKAYPNAIPEQMTVPGLSGNHIASHTQFLVDLERGRLTREQRSALSAPSHCYASKFQSNSVQPSNLAAASFFPVLTAATSGGQAPDNSYMDLLHQAPGETFRSSALGLYENPNRSMTQGSQVKLQDKDYTDTMVTGENYSLPDFGFDSSYSGGASSSSIFEVPATSVVRGNVTSQYYQGASGNLLSNGFDSSYSRGASSSSIFEVPARSVVRGNVTSQYYQGANGNLFSNGFGTSNSGGASGSGISEAPATFVVCQNVESQYTVGANADENTNGVDNSNSGGAIDSGISATFSVGANVESPYNRGGNKYLFSSAFDNSNSGGSSGSGISEGLPTSVVGANVESQYTLGENANVYSNGFDNSISGGAIDSGISATFAVGANVESPYKSSAFDNSNSGGASSSGISEAPASFVVCENVNSNGVDNSNSGGASGTGISATFVVGADVESQFDLGTNPNVFTSAFDNSNSGGASGSGTSELLPTSVVVANVESEYNLGLNPNISLKGFYNSNSGDASGSDLFEQLATVDVFGIPIESHTTATDGVPSPSDGGSKDLAHPVLYSSDLGGGFHPQNNFDNSQILRSPVSVGEEKYANNSWLKNMLETDTIISMGNYNEHTDVFSYDP